MAKLAVNWIGAEDFPLEFDVNETSFDCDVCRPGAPQFVAEAFAPRHAGATSAGHLHHQPCTPIEVRASRDEADWCSMGVIGYKLF